MQNDKFEQTLANAENLAERIELQLPHVSDSMYALIKLIRTFDKNIKKAAKVIIEEQRINKDLYEMAKYMARFLSAKELEKVNKHMKKRRKGKK